MLVPRIIAEKEYPDLPAGTVVQQKPEPQTSIRLHQTIMLVLSKQPDPLRVPSLVGSTIDASAAACLKIGLQPQIYEFESDEQVHDTCIAQWPSPQSEIKQGTHIILYCVKTIKKPYIVPHFEGLRVHVAKEICEKYGIHCQVIHATEPNVGHECTDCIIRNQRPLPGTLCTLDTIKKMVFQFQV
jgi:beta-lactam-binding protein with PASTA domain